MSKQTDGQTNRLTAWYHFSWRESFMAI